MVTSPGTAWFTAKTAVVALLFSLLLTRAPGADEGPRPALRVFSHSSYRPYAYFENSEAKGLAIDLLQELARRLDRPLDVMPLELEQSKERLARGEADAFFPMVRMDGTDEQFDFSEPVYTLHFAIFTSAAQSGISSVANLRGLRVGVTASGFGRQLLQDDSAIQLVPMNDYAHGIALLRAGDIDALIADRWVGASEIATRSIHGVQVASGDVTTLPAMLMVRKGDAATLAAFNGVLRTMHDDGTIERLLDKWRPPEVVFVPGESANWPAIVGGFSLLFGLLAVMGAWTITLRREVALRREREREVVALHQRLAIATQAGGIGIWDWDVARDVLVWDDEMHRLYGVRKEDSRARMPRGCRRFTRMIVIAPTRKCARRSPANGLMTPSSGSACRMEPPA